MKTGWKKGTLFVMTALLAGSLLLAAGCRSSIELALLEKEQRATPVLLELSELHSDAEGFHYPGFSWGGTFTDFQKVTNGAITAEEGISETGQLYEAGDMHRLVLERQNDSASVEMGDGELITSISLRFEKGASETTFGTFAESVKSELIRLYGEPQETVSHQETISSATYQLDTFVWKKRVGDKVTEIQFGLATLPGATDPSFAALGVDWYAE